ncbi:DEAD/DEAH box helicase [Nocardioides nematodiphilus]|uniref:DEAD/DEAH box helicase n=1 Tax=Nocardioides nematodiphilus TaxID=2849669 RepID=UPI001CD9ED7D|nr:DEAD/DEAH box helicase [Nocardioides nematodiphilus]MCA1982198.1 hypothetical protein [Nocardioides nematodiphilus]
MATSDELTTAALRARISSGDLGDEAFRALSFIASLLSGGRRDVSNARDLLIRMLDLRSQFGPSEPAYEALLREAGLFAYIRSPENLPVGDLLALEAHRPLDFPDPDVIFHPVQARAYRYLLSGRSVILSAPTSFGKSLILDAVLRSGRFDNVAVVVPTLALIDETRRRLIRLGSGHRVISHPSQSLGERNVLVMTQERLLEVEPLPPLDLFMIDEFYKLSIPAGQPDRSALLNHALHRLMKTGAPFYFAGPNVQTIADGLPELFEAAFIATDYATVAVDMVVLPRPRREERIAALLNLCQDLEGPTLIYCSRPESARNVAAALLDAGLGRQVAGATDAADWVAREFHPEWLVGRAMRHGIGIHHGKLPRALAQYQVDSFNDGRLDWLVCTSTLIEGVNTTAKNVVIYDHILNGRVLDYFSFANIKGRSGRMRRHFVGKVYVFRDPPSENLPTVDIPLYSQSDDVPESLLIQLDDQELTERSRERLRGVLDQEIVPVETLQMNAGIDPSRQIELVRHVRSLSAFGLRQLAWTGLPTYDQLQAASQLIINFLNPISGRQHGVSSANQLTFRMNLARSVDGDVRSLVEQELVNPRSEYVDDPDGAVEATLDFLRHWPGFLFPKLLIAAQNLVNPTLTEAHLRADYSVFAAQCLNLFLPDQVVVLEEYGFPAQAAESLIHRLRPYDDLDSLLVRLAQVDPALVSDTFERELLIRAQEGLRPSESA